VRDDLRKITLTTILMVFLFIFSILNVTTIGVSAYDSPAIYIEPASTVDETLTYGSTYNISIKTDYDGTDIWGWQFTLDYNPKVLQGGLNTTHTWPGDDVETKFNATTVPVVPYSEKIYLDLDLVAKISAGSDLWIGNGVTTLFVTSGKPVHEDTEWVYVNFTDTWVGDAVEKIFNTTEPIMDDSEKVYVDGELMIKPNNYTVNYDAGKIYFNCSLPAPGGGAAIKVTYDVEMYRDVDFTLNYATGAINFMSPPSSGQKVQATYMYGHYIIDYEGLNPGQITFRTAPGTGVTVKAIYMGNGQDNGGLIPEGHPGYFEPGTFDNTAGELSLTVGFFYDLFPPPPMVSGPGTLANITFTVVGLGKSDIILGPDTQLKGYDGGFYTPIDGEATPVEILDLGFIGLAYGTVDTDPEWEDLNYKIADTIGPGGGPPDGVVEILDLGYCGLQYGSVVGIDPI